MTTPSLPKREPRRRRSSASPGSFRWRALLGVLLVGLLQGSPAAAEPARPDKDVVVSLDDGSSLRGKLVELVPGSRCVIVLPTAERRTILWSAIARIDSDPPPAESGDGVRGPRSTRTTESATAPAEPPAASGLTAIVSMSAPASVDLQRSTPDGGWVSACRAPCDLALPIDASYRLVEDGRPISTLRLLPDGAAKVALDVRLARPGLKAFGGVLTGLGGVLLYAALAIASERTYGDEDNGSVPVAVAGVLGLAVGIPLLALNSSSDTFSQRPVRDDAPERAAPWIKRAAGPTLSSPRTTSLLTVRF